MRDFLLPDLGEGLTESELLEWHVAVGDTVTLNQTLAEVETAKAIVQLPSPFAGVIAKLYAEAGTTVAVGAPIVGFETDDSAPAAFETDDSAPVPEASQGTGSSAAADAAPPARTPVLVGYGPEADSASRPKRSPRAHHTPAEVPVPPDSARSATAHGAHSGATGTIAGPARTTPPVRKLAADLGVDLHTITGTGPDGIITRDDVTQAAESARSGPLRPAQQAHSSGTGTSERRTPIKGVRKHTAAAMVESAFTAPHATVFLTVDVTRTTELIGRLKAAGEQASLLGVIAKAMCLALRRHPSLNSHWDEPAQEIVEYDAVQLGIAVASDRGLIVPVIPDAHLLTVADLTASIAGAAAAVRDGSLPQERLSGGTISISNVGVFGVDAGTPILVPGQAAILATGAVRRMPWAAPADSGEDAIALRDVMTLSLSFDHRLVDGEQGSRFLADIGRLLTDPGTALAL